RLPQPCADVLILRPPAFALPPRRVFWRLAPPLVCGRPPLPRECALRRRRVDVLPLRDAAPRLLPLRAGAPLLRPAIEPQFPGSPYWPPPQLAAGHFFLAPLLRLPL